MHPAIVKNMENSLVESACHILIRESRNVSISAMLNSFLSNVSKE